MKNKEAEIFFHIEIFQCRLFRNFNTGGDPQLLSKIRFVFLSLIFYFQVSGQQAPLSSNAIFAPIVTATCRAGLMTVKVETLDNFLGVVQSRDYRKPECSGYGENSKITYLRVNMLAKSSDPEYCGVFINEVRMIIPMFSFCHRFSFNESTVIPRLARFLWQPKNRVRWNSCYASLYYDLKKFQKIFA